MLSLKKKNPILIHKRVWTMESKNVGLWQNQRTVIKLIKTTVFFDVIIFYYNYYYYDFVSVLSPPCFVRDNSHESEWEFAWTKCTLFGSTVLIYRCHKHVPHSGGLLTTNNILKLTGPN